MNWSSLFKSVPSLLGLVGKIFVSRKTPPKRADEILGGPDTPTKSQQGKDAADAAADAKFGK